MDPGIRAAWALATRRMNRVPGFRIDPQYCLVMTPMRRVRKALAVPSRRELVTTEATILPPGTIPAKERRGQRGVGPC